MCSVYGHYDIYGQAGDDSLKGLADALERLATQWNFRYRGPMPDLSYNEEDIDEMFF